MSSGATACTCYPFRQATDPPNIQPRMHLDAEFSVSGGGWLWVVILDVRCARHRARQGVTGPRGRVRFGLRHIRSCRHGIKSMHTRIMYGGSSVRRQHVLRRVRAEMMRDRSVVVFCVRDTRCDAVIMRFAQFRHRRHRHAVW